MPPRQDLRHKKRTVVRIEETGLETESASSGDEDEIHWRSMGGGEAK